MDGEGIYYDPKKNQTAIINSCPDNEPELMFEHKGYINIDLQFNMGDKISNQFTGILGNGLDELC